ncbi:hypothetical protein PC9H_007002 [Pleurotus ostreatus]|uniref:Uncharacterized protein n=1 Tax=Pleurotus ostreatus TaxID=5322 RepID=A0A8H7DR18_PLEOS|nr:uncharacterized protein PC9H_007002 [Pleurotus ostreatus]KAF7427787.1 hypothetical protein PC9H_007002 [Pleurotus ostreatus]KAJ8695757.1 hypothetical protein PTI98_005686 [Pleurotus ostreatus]
MPPRVRKSDIAPIDWTDDRTWALIGEMEECHNAKVLFGKKEKDENTSGERKIMVYKAIAAKLFPEESKLYAKAMGDRVKSKVEALRKKYIIMAKRLKQTGDGLTGDDASQEVADGPIEVYMPFYISPEGPDHDTIPEARNIWEQICKDLPYFPALHRLWASRPNVVPPVVTTGIGPRGRSVVYMQDPHRGALAEDLNRDNIPIDPVLLAMERELFSPTADLFRPLIPLDDDPPAPGAPIVHPPGRFFGADATNTPSSSQASADDDTPPPPTPSQSRKGPKVSHLSDEALNKAKASIQVVPKKRSFEESIIDVQMQQIKQLADRADADRNVKIRKLMLKELELGVMTPAQYRRRLKKMGMFSDDENSDTN